ncbi:MAG: GNAT family protein [Cyanobacteriota bacterium]
MKINLLAFDRVDSELLYDFFISEDWKFHTGSKSTKETFLSSVEKGNYDGISNKSFWLVNDESKKIGFLKIEDLDDDIPRFDLRILSEYRGKKIGEQALNEMTNYIFNNYPEIYRIEGCTREDNFSMRKVFKKCSYIKEGHFRKSWAGKESKNYKEYYDSILYATIREDWEEKKTTFLKWDDDNF